MKVYIIITSLMLAACGSDPVAPPVKDTTIDTCAEARAALFDADGKAEAEVAQALVKKFCN